MKHSKLKIIKNQQQGFFFTQQMGLNEQIGVDGGVQHFGGQQTLLTGGHHTLGLGIKQHSIDFFLTGEQSLML